jgi:hypothetical protein
MYAGWDYRGFASQDDEGGVTTVEAGSLLRTCTRPTLNR